MSHRIVLAIAIGILSSTARAELYTLEPVAGYPHAQLQPREGGSSLCATWIDSGECDIDLRATYRRIDYTEGWVGRTDREWTPSSSAFVTTVVREECIFEPDLDNEQICTATCPSNTTLTGGACWAFEAFVNDQGESEEPGVPKSTGTYVGSGSYNCLATENPFGNPLVFLVEAICARLR